MSESQRFSYDFLVGREVKFQNGDDGTSRLATAKTNHSVFKRPENTSASLTIYLNDVIFATVIMAGTFAAGA